MKQLLLRRFIGSSQFIAATWLAAVLVLVTIAGAKAQEKEAPAAPSSSSDVILSYSGNDLPGTPEDIAEHERRAAESNKYALRGHELLEKGDIRGAIAAYQQAVKTNPGPVTLYLLDLADAYARNGQTQEAIRAYQDFIFPEPEAGVEQNRVNYLHSLNAQHLAKYALLLTQAGDYAQAVDVYNIAATQIETQRRPLYPDQFSVKNLNKRRFEAVLRVLKWDGTLEPEAAADYRKALALQPDYALAYLFLGNLLSDEKPSEAREAFCKAVELGRGEVLQQAQAQKALLR